MTDFKFEMSGIYGTGRVWSTGVKASAAGDLATALIDWGTQVASFWTNGSHGVETLYAPSTELTAVTVTQLDATGHVVQEVSAPETLVGTAATQEGANQLAVLVSLRNAFAGERNRGRMYLPSPAEGAVDEGVLGSTEGTRVSTAISALFGGMRTAGYTFFVWNEDTSPRDPVAFTKKTLTQEKVDRVLRTQRRRISKELAIYV